MRSSNTLTKKEASIHPIRSVVYPLVVRLKENTPTAAFSKLLLLLLTAKGSLSTLSPLQLFQTFTPVRRNGAYQRAQALEQLRRRVAAFPSPQQQKQELIYTSKPWSGHTVGRSKVAQDRTVPCVFLVRGKINQNIQHPASTPFSLYQRRVQFDEQGNRDKNPITHTHTHTRNRPSVRPVLVPVAATTIIKWYILLYQRNPVSSVSASVRETHQTLQTFRWPNGRPSSTNMKTRTRPSIITISVKLNQTRASNFAPYSGQLYCTCTCVQV